MIPMRFILPFISSDVPVSANGPGKPRVLYKNEMFAGSPISIVATSEPDPADYPYQYAYDGLPSNYYKVAAGTNYLTFVFGSAIDVNAYGFYSPGDETLGNLGGTIQLQYNLGAGWVDFLPPESPTDNTPIYRSVATVSAAQWRWKFVCGSDFYVSVLSFGKDFEFERGIWTGFSPPFLARDTELTNNVSQGGNWLGRSIIRNGATFTIALEDITLPFVYNEWLPFMKWAERRPWFLLWNPRDYPAESAFCWCSDKKIPRPMISKAGKGFMTAKMTAQARVD